MTLLSWLLAGWAAAIAVGDIVCRRVPNALLLIAAVPALGFLVLRGQGPLGAGWRDALAGAAVCAVLWLPGFIWRKLGAGDVKYAACIGLLLGVLPGLRAMLAAALLLGLMAAAMLSRGRRERLPAAVALSGGLLLEYWGALRWIV